MKGKTQISSRRRYTATCFRIYLDRADRLFMEMYTVAIVGLTVMHCATSLNSLLDRPLLDSMRAMAVVTLGFAAVLAC